MSKVPSRPAQNFDASNSHAVLKALPTPESCEKFRQNAIRLGHHDLAKSALKRAVSLRAENNKEASSEVEKACLKAVYAYEAALAKKNGKKTSASRTWQMIRRRGIIGAAEQAVDRSHITVGYETLVEMGLEEYAFENVILRFPDSFSEDAVQRARERIGEPE